MSGAVNALAGRREGDKIILAGEEADDAIRWSFHDITADSFLWIGERQTANGDWKKDAEFRLRRISD